MLKKTLLASILFIPFASAQAAEIPDSATLNFRSSIGIPATMTFKRSGNHYTVTANINVPKYKIRFESGGTIVDKQLHPTYYRDTRNGKLYASAQFAKGQALLGKVDDKHVERVSGVVLDLFTLSWQLAFANGKLAANTQVTNGKKMYRISQLSSIGSKQISVNGVNTPVQQFRMMHGDNQVVYGFASELGGVPAIINYADGSQRYNLTLKSATINGVSVNPKPTNP